MQDRKIARPPEFDCADQVYTGHKPETKIGTSANCGRLEAFPGVPSKKQHFI
jgi:hypothetical protein